LSKRPLEFEAFPDSRQFDAVPLEG